MTRKLDIVWFYYPPISFLFRLYDKTKIRDQLSPGDILSDKNTVKCIDRQLFLIFNFMRHNEIIHSL